MAILKEPKHRRQYFMICINVRQQQNGASRSPIDFWLFRGCLGSHASIGYILDRYVWWKKNVELKNVYNFDTHTYYKFFPSSEQTDQRTRKRLTNGPNHVEVREYWDKSASQYSQVILVLHWCCLIVYHFSLQTLVLCSSVMMLGQQQKQAAHYIASQAASMVDAA